MQPNGLKNRRQSKFKRFDGGFFSKMSKFFCFLGFKVLNCHCHPLQFLL